MLQTFRDRGYSQIQPHSTLDITSELAVAMLDQHGKTLSQTYATESKAILSDELCNEYLVVPTSATRGNIIIIITRPTCI